MRCRSGSVSPPQPMVVKITTMRVVEAYTSLLAPGMPVDSANAMAPRSPANHITTCMLAVILRCRL